MTSEAPDANDAGVGAGGEVVGADVLVADVEESVAVDRESGSLAVELEDDQSRVVT